MTYGRVPATEGLLAVVDGMGVGVKVFSKSGKAIFMVSPITNCGSEGSNPIAFFFLVIRSHLALGERVIGEIPKRLLAFAWLIHSLISFAFMVHIHEESVITPQHELTFEFVFAVSEGVLNCFISGSIHKKVEGQKSKVVDP